MPSAGVGAGFAKCFILFMSIVILLQGCAYLGLAIWGITLEKCSAEPTNISDNPFKFAIDLIYFAREECGAPEIHIPQIDQTQPIIMDWATSFTITNRLNIFLITYAVISALWIVSSLLVIASICGPVTKVVSAICYWPWFILVMAGCVLDAVATGFFGNDISQTSSAAATFEYVGGSINQAIMEYLSDFDSYFIMPAVVMTCISSRVVLIWLLNIFGTSFCLSLSNVLAKANRVNKNVPAPARPAPSPMRQQYAGPAGTRPYSHQEPRSATPQYAEVYPPQIKPKPLPVQTADQIQRLNSYQQQPQQQPRPQPQQQPQQQQQQQDQYPYKDRRTMEPLKAPAEDYRRSSSPAPVAAVPSDNHGATPNRQTSMANEYPTYRNADTHPDRLDYPAPTAPTETRSTSPELSPISPLNQRYSTQEGGSQFTNPSQRVSDELRSQLPWSYTMQQPPRRVQSQATPTTSSSVYPEVPEPDYR